MFKVQEGDGGWRQGEGDEAAGRGREGLATLHVMGRGFPAMQGFPHIYYIIIRLNFFTTNVS